jgi:cation diffusion facilitator CzcD-associated flavoprotein CzcO
VLSHLYCLARYPNPDWTAAYATQPEILNYLRQATKEAGLEPHLRLGSVVVEAQFLQDHGCWRLILGSGAACHVRMLILATGLQNRPLTPALPSLELFHGSTFHSARWDTSVDLREKRVAVIGTGASSVQIVPSLAGKAAQLVVFQRTPAWVFPRKDRTFSKLQRRILHAFPATQAVARVTINWLMELVGQGFLGTSLVNRLVQFIALRHLRSQVSDEEIRSKLTPDHLIGCKRLVMSDDFYPAFNRPDVALVTAPISAVEPTGIRTSDGTLHEVDHIVFATGFTVADFAGRLRVVGRDGRVLSEVWTSAPEAYLGITVSGFPNLAMLLGPNSALGHSSQLQIIESQVKYVIQYIDALRAHDDGVVFNVLPAVQDDYNRAIQARLANTIWATGCNSWYLDRLGRNTTIFPGLARHYRKLTARFDVASYACERVQAIRAS